MQTRALGNSGLDFSVVGLGTWALGGGDWKFGWGDQGENESLAVIGKAVELGINWIDPAAVYGWGVSETLVGQALRSIPPSERPLIATKCGRKNRGNGEIFSCLSRDSVMRECEDSLKRLGIDCIDLYQLHWPQPDEQIEEGWQALVDLKQQGKVRHIGVSNHNVEQLKRLQAIHPVTSLSHREIDRPHIGAEGREWVALAACGNQDAVVLDNSTGAARRDATDKRNLISAFVVQASRLPDTRLRA